MVFLDICVNLYIYIYAYICILLDFKWRVCVWILYVVGHTQGKGQYQIMSKDSVDTSSDC